MAVTSPWAFTVTFTAWRGATAVPLVSLILRRVSAASARCFWYSASMSSISRSYGVLMRCPSSDDGAEVVVGRDAPGVALLDEQVGGGAAGRLLGGGFRLAVLLRGLLDELAGAAGDSGSAAV